MSKFVVTCTVERILKGIVEAKNETEARNKAKNFDFKEEETLSETFQHIDDINIIKKAKP